MKIVINVCGFSLSPLATKLWAEAQGRECYFFENPKLDLHTYVPLTLEAAEKASMWHAFDIPNPNEVLSTANWAQLSLEARIAANKLHKSHDIYAPDADRADPALVAVVEQLGAKANGRHAELKVVELPDGVEYTIEEYDGNEHVAEKHRTWA